MSLDKRQYKNKNIRYLKYSMDEEGSENNKWKQSIKIEHYVSKKHWAAAW